MLENLNLDGRVVVITGGGTGLGLEMVRALTRSGANLAIAGRRPGPIEAARDEALADGRDAIAVPTDVSNSSHANGLIDAAVAHFGRVDVLINNAAMVADNVLKPIWEITDDDWESAMSINLSGAFFCARAAAKAMADVGKGKIINVASGFGLRGGRDIYMYCASKGGIINLTRVLSFSLARYGITANSIVPGFIPTIDPSADINRTLPQTGDFLPSGKLGRAEELGPIAVFLASDASDYMSGEMFILDGGGLAAGIAPTGHAPLAALEE